VVKQACGAKIGYQ